MAPTRAIRTGDSVDDDSAFPDAPRPAGSCSTAPRPSESLAVSTGRTAAVAPRPVDARAEAAAAKSEREIKKIAAKAAKAARRDIVDRLTDVAIEAKAKSHDGPLPHKFWHRLIAPYQDAEYAITKDVIKGNVRRKMARARVAGEGTPEAARASRRDIVTRLTDAVVEARAKSHDGRVPHKFMKNLIAPYQDAGEDTITKDMVAGSVRRKMTMARFLGEDTASLNADGNEDPLYCKRGTSHAVNKVAAKATRAERRDIVDRLTGIAIEEKAKSDDGPLPHKFWNRLIAPYQDAEYAITKNMIKSNVRRKMIMARVAGDESVSFNTDENEDSSYNKRGTVHVAPWPGAERKKRRRTSERADAPSTKKPDASPALNLPPATNPSISVAPNPSEVSVLNETNRAVASIIADSLVDERFQSGKPKGGLKLRLDVLHSHFPFLSKEEVQDEVRRKMEERLEGESGGEGSGASAETER